MKLLLQGFLALVLCFSISATAYPQDTTKKIEPPKSEPAKFATPRVEPLKSSAAKTAAVRPALHAKPKVTPIAPQVNPKDTAQAAMNAQTDQAALNDKSLNGQYQYLLTKVYHYQQPLIGALWKNAMDSLNQARTNLKQAQAKLGSQSKLIDSLQLNSKSEQQTLTASNHKVDNISVFGADMSKSNYNLLMFGLVGVLAIALAIVIGTTAKHRHEAKYRTELYEEIEEDFKAFKAKAHEKELKLARDLQTERNKLDELLNKDGK